MTNKKLSEDELPNITGGASKAPNCSTCTLFIPINSNDNRVSSNCKNRNVQSGTCKARLNDGKLPFFPY